MKKIYKVTQAQLATLQNGGSITVGDTTYTYETGSDVAYVIVDPSHPEYALTQTDNKLQFRKNGTVADSLIVDFSKASSYATKARNLEYDEGETGVGTETLHFNLYTGGTVKGLTTFKGGLKSEQEPTENTDVANKAYVKKVFDDAYPTGALAAVATSGSYNDLKDTPTLSYLPLTGGTVKGNLTAPSFIPTATDTFSTTENEYSSYQGNPSINTRTNIVVLAKMGTNGAHLHLDNLSGSNDYYFPQGGGTFAMKSDLSIISAIGQYNHAIKIYANYTTETNGITTYHYLSAFFEIRSNYQEKITSIDKLYEIGTTGRCVCNGFYSIRNTATNATYNLLYVDTTGMTTSSAGAAYFAYGNSPTSNPATLTISTITGSNSLYSNIEDIVC